jgi:CRISPR/Cas system-associated protein Cas5 (RAMP superfamily)
MTKYYLVGALEAFLWSLPVPSTLVLLSLIVPLPFAFIGALAFGLVLLLYQWRSRYKRKRQIDSALF